MSIRRVQRALVGAVDTSATPAERADLLGHVTLEPTGRFVVRSLASFTLTYTVGAFGLDDTGALRVAFRFPADWGTLQTTDATAVNYVSTEASNGTRLMLDYNAWGNPRPWWKALTIRVVHGCLAPGDTVSVRLGDRSGGSPGMKLQTFCEEAFEFRVLVDACATGHFVEVPNSPVISIVPGPPHTWKLLLPTLRRVGESFLLGLKAEDEWGNPTDQADAEIGLEANLPVENLPQSISYERGMRAFRLESLKVSESGVLRITAHSGDGIVLAVSNPLTVSDTSEHSSFWGDLHGQTGETCGINTARSYFEFARDLAFLDVSSHQGNDFQINNAFWSHLNELTAEFNEHGRFVAIPGYEWSGNTAVGGDRNIFFRCEGQMIRRSSHALIAEHSDIGSDCRNARLLFEALQDEDVVAYAHVGGRYADIAYAHDGLIERSLEIHSAWGTFEWLMSDAFDLGYRPGVVCNSDGHKGRPGASHPGASMFGAYGGLTCFFSRELTRAGIFQCLRRRHHYGTTGNRLHLEVSARFDTSGVVFDEDPDLSETSGTETPEVMMGDIAASADTEVTVSVRIAAGTPIERVEVRNGKDVVRTFRPYRDTDCDNRIRVIWQGAEYRGRGRQTVWDGTAALDGCEILGYAKINAWNHERKFEQIDSQRLEWEAITTGNFGGFDVWLNDSSTGILTVETQHVSDRINLASVGLEDVVLDGGGLDRKIRVFRMPEENPHTQVCFDQRVRLHDSGDNPLWVCVTTEDGFQAWSSPIYLFLLSGGRPWGRTG